MRVRLRKNTAQYPIKKKSGFEVRTGRGIFERADPVPQIQASRALFRRAQQSQQSPAKVGGFADIGLGAAFSAEHEDRGSRGRGSEELVIAACIELKPVGQHTGILDAIRQGGTPERAGCALHPGGICGRITSPCKSRVKNSTASGSWCSGPITNLPMAAPPIA